MRTCYNKSPEINIKNGEVKFSAVGDIALGDHPLCVGFGAHSIIRKMPVTFPFQYVINHLKKADIVFGNLECALSEKGLKKGNYRSVQMRGKSIYAKGLVEAGFKILNLANNHSMQHGREAFLETISLLESHGIKYCGTNGDGRLNTKPNIFEINGIKIGFLGYSLRPRQYFAFTPLYSEGTLMGIVRDINEVKSNVDKTIVSLHWGEEFIDFPSQEEIAMARQIINAGADLIIGHHPHVLRPIEKYKQGIIIYSLGNFVCDMVWDQRLRESLIFNCRITKQGIQDIELTPIYINDRYQPEIMEGRDGEMLLSRISNLLMESYTKLHPIEKEMANYQKIAEEVQRFYRMKARRFFLSHLYNYPLPILFQLILNFAINRFKQSIKQFG